MRPSLISKTAFTLVELLVVMSIVGVLMAVLLPNLMGARERAKDGRKIEELSTMKNALRMYYNDYQAYPTAGSGNSLGVGMTQYMPGIMGLGYTYTYTQTDNGDGFLITVGLDVGSGDDDVDSQARCGVGATVDKVYAVCAK